MNVHDTRRQRGLVATLGALFAGAMKVGLAIVGFVFMLGVMMVGFTLGLAVLLWARLTGRRPNVAFATRWPAGRVKNPFHVHGNPSAAGKGHYGEVIDVEAREMPGAEPAGPSHLQVDAEHPAR